MLSTLFQIKIRFFPDFIFFILIPSMMVVEAFALKIGLKITKAPEKTGMKWVFVSWLIQVGIFLFIGSPLILMAISGAFYQQGPDPSIIIPIMFIGLFININVLNVIHKPGLKGACIIYFVLIIIGIIYVFIMFGIVAAMNPDMFGGNGGNGGNGGGG